MIRNGYKWFAGVMVILAVFSLPDFAAKAETKHKTAGSAADGPSAAEKEPAVAEIMDAFKKAYPQFPVKGIQRSPVVGLYELEGGGNIFYFDPRGSYLLFGDILSKDGKNWTQERRDELAAKNIARLPLDKAVKIGNGPKTVILFTDPDCPYCRKVSDYLDTVSPHITQYVFFLPLKQLHPHAEAKVRHILSSDHPDRAYKEIMEGKYDKADPKDLKSGEAAAAKMAEHVLWASRVGINGTPSMYIEGKYVAGANMPLIESLLKAPQANAKK